MNRRWLIPATLVAANAALCAFLLYSASRGWFGGAPDRCVAAQTCFCEEFRPGPVKQPANTFSNLGFMLVGLACALHAVKNGKPGGGRLQATTFHPALFCTVLALLGPGSMALHASMTDWGGKVDVASMDLFIGVVAAFGLSRRFRWGDGTFLAVAAAFVAVAMAVKLSPAVKSVPMLGRGESTFGALVAVFVFNELLPEDASTRLADKTWLARAAACFFSAFGIWLLSRTPTSLLCSPTSLLQGHAAWHLLTACGAGCLYPYLLQERPFATAPAAAPPEAEPA